MDHNKEFDGIKQADNPLPPWWVAIWMATIVFAIGYAIYFTATGWTSKGQFSGEVAAHDKRFPPPAVLKSVDGSNPLRGDAKAAEEGKNLFMQGGCVACHGMDAKGVVGPNLTDDQWIHGDNDETLYGLVMEGIPQEKTTLNRGPMPAHKASLGSEKVYKILAWIAEINPSLKKLK